MSFHEDRLNVDNKKMASFVFKFAFLSVCVALAAGQNAPEIFVAPTAMHVDYGSTAYMACVAYIGTESQSSIVTTMNWYDPHSGLLSNNSDSSVTVTTTRTTQGGQVFIKSILKLCNFTTSNFGTYTCRVTNIYGQNERNWIVSIVQLPITPQLLTSPNSITTMAGNTIYMTCSAYGYPYPSIIWRKDNQVVQSDGVVSIDTRVTNYNGAKVSVSTLKICGADSDNVGSYTCTANVRDIGQVTSTAWRLDVTPVPIISNAPDDHTISYGVTAYMTCTAYLGTQAQRADTIASTLTWTGPGDSALTNRSDGTVNVYAERVVQNGQVFMKSYLKICNFTQSNSGQYACRISNANGMDTKTWSASLPYAVALPQLVAVPSTQTAREGNSIYMTCAAYGYPFPDVTWYKNGQPIVSGSDLFTISSNVVNYNGAQVVQSDLRICLSTVQDSGSYSCSFTTRDFGTLSSTPVTLTVLPVPEIVIAPESQTVNYGVTFFMTCAAHVGNTAQNVDQLGTTVTWMGPGSEALTNSTTGVTVYTDTTTSQGGDVIIRSIIQVCGFTQALQGVYSCRVSNANGQDIKMWNNTLPRNPVAPTVVASPTTRTVSEGNSVLMACAGYGYPTPVITWYRNGQPVAPGRVLITNRIANYNGALVAESTMKICGAGEEDHGSYYCSFNSAFGNAVNSNTWQVNVNPAPTIVVAPQNNQVEVGNTVFMSCAAYVGTQAQGADSITTTFAWLGPDSTAISSSTEMEVLTDTSIQSGRVFVRSILKICRFTQENAGRYTCRVSNANGVENRTWTTIFPQTPSIPQLAAVSAYDSVTLGKTVYFACAMYGYPQPQISWTKDGAALPSSTTVTTNVITINNLNVTQSVVRVCGFQGANIGLYQCLGTNSLGNALGYVQITPEAPEIVVSPPSTEVNYANSIFMSCIAYVGRMNRSVDQLQTTFSWWDRNNNQLTNRSDGSVSIFTDSFNRNGLVFLRSILQICNFTTPNTGMHSCRAMNSNGQGSATWNLTFTRSPLAPFFLVTPSTQPITAAYGRTFYIECAAYGFPPPQMSWWKDGQAINTSSPLNRVIIDTSVTNYLGAQVTQSILRICGVGEEDIGSYVCTASTSVFGTSISTMPVTLGVSPVPTIVISPMDQDITFGKTTLMACVAFVGLASQNAASIPTAVSWWNPNSQQLVNNSDNSITVYPRTQTRGGRVFAESILKICNVSHALEGRYACQVSNNNGLETRYWNVSIPQQPFAPSIVAFPVPQSTRRFGFTAVMACAAYGYPPPVISFNQRGQPIDQADLDGSFRVKNSVQTYLGGVDVALGVLEVCAFDYDDIGTYTCTATARNVGSVTSDSWNVDILPAPYVVVSPRSQNVSYDTVLRMTCTAALGRPSDNPPDTTMTWYDGTGMVMDSNSPGVTITTTMMTNSTENIIYLVSNAVVSDIGLQHFGRLMCTANNSLGWDSASWYISPTEMYFPPQGISLEGNSQVVSCGNPITLTCNVWGYPPPDVIWTLNATNIDTSSQMDTIGFNYTTSQLVINQFSVPNAGVYVCTARNENGTAKTNPVVLSLDTEVVLETAAPSITSSVRTSSDLAVVQFKPVTSASGQEFVVSYYSVANSSGTPDLSQRVRDGSVQSAQTQVTLSGLLTCSSYWVTVAVVNSCGVRRSGQSEPKLVGLHDTSTYELLVTLTTKTCTTWITENANTKISDMTRRLQLAASTCGITIPCIVSSQWQCQNDDPYKARFSTTLVGNDQTPTPSIVSCINKWFTDNPGVSLSLGNVSYAVGLVPSSGTGPQVNGATIGIAVAIVIAVVVGIVVAAIIAVVMFRSRNNRKPAKKERLEEPQEDFSEVYSRHSFAVVENPLFADQEEGDDTSYGGGAEGYEYDSGTLEKKEDLGADDDDVDDRAFI